MHFAIASSATRDQGALIAFLNGNGRAYAPAGDSLSTLRDCGMRNIHGVSGGSALHGGVAIKFYCANSSLPIVNCWAEDVFVRQDDTTPPDTLRAGVLILTGRPDGGVLASGVRNLTVSNRSGSLLAIGPADEAPVGYSKKVDFTVDQARGVGKGTWPGQSLIAAPYADRLVLRDVSGDLSGNVGGALARALSIGTDVTYILGGVGYTIAAGTVKALVIDGVATDNAAPVSGSGVWRFGNIVKASIRRLSTTLETGASAVGGIELIQPSGGPGPSYCRFAEIDFANTAAGSEIVTWQTKVGDQIVDSIGFDDRVATVAASNATLAPSRFAPTMTLTRDPLLPLLVVNAMTPPGVPAPRCTLLVPANVQIDNSGTGSGSFQMKASAPLAGSATASITFQWMENGNRWREVARTA
jgi:hypothetical protein